MYCRLEINHSSFISEIKENFKERILSNSFDFSYGIINYLFKWVFYPSIIFNFSVTCRSFILLSYLISVLRVLSGIPHLSMIPSEFLYIVHSSTLTRKSNGSPFSITCWSLVLLPLLLIVKSVGSCLHLSVLLQTSEIK